MASLRTLNPGARMVACLTLALTSAVGALHARASDVPYVPTPPAVVEAMLDLAKVGPGDYVIDLGSGDGRIVIAAAKRYGARGMGVDIDGALVSDARREAQKQGVADRVAFHARNLFITEIDAATVLTMYLFPRVLMQLRPRLLTELRPGTRIVSHEFDLESWQPDGRVTVPVPDKPYGEPRSDVYLWIVPVNAAGIWRGRLGSADTMREVEVALEQTFQMLSGRGRLDGQPAQLANARVRGVAVEFVLVSRIDGRDVRHEFNGRVSGDGVAGSVMVQGQRLEWNAARVARGKMQIESSAPYPARSDNLAQER